MQVGMHGIFVGLGEFLGGLVFGILGSHIVKRGRDPIVALGFVVHSAAAFGVFLNIPDTAPLGDTNGGCISTSKWVYSLFTVHWVSGMVTDSYKPILRLISAI